VMTCASKLSADVPAATVKHARYAFRMRMTAT
jgi:hypothetical protein